MKQRKQNIILYGMAFFIPFGLLIIYFLSQNTSFDKLLISDSNEQYIYLFRYLKEVLLGNQSLIYSFSKGIGGSMIGTFLYYLACPLNLLVVFVEDSMLPAFVGILSFVKISLSGMTMFFYLTHHNKNTKILNLAFSIGYALMSYNIIYYFNIMWLDTVYLTPIVIHGLDCILENKKSKLFTIAFTLTIFIHYYTAYMLGIFIIIYFFYRLLTKYDIKKDKKIMLEIIKKITIHIGLCLVISAIIFLPLLKELKGTFREDYFYNRTGIVSGSLNIVSQLGFHLQTTKVLYAIPYIFCGFMPVVVFFSYFFTKNNDKDKKYILFVFILFFLSLLLKNLNLLWHGFSPPILFCYRFTFLLDFFIIIIAAEKFSMADIPSVKKSILFSIIYIAIIIIGVYFGDVVANYISIIVNLFFLLATFLLYRICLKFPKTQYYIAIVLITVLQSFVLIKFNFTTNKNMMNQKEVNVYLDEIKQFHNYIATENRNHSRINGNVVWKENEMFGSSTSKIGSFLSSVDGNVIKFLSNSGYHAIASDIRDNLDNKVMNTILGVDYQYNSICDDTMERLPNVVVKDRTISLCKRKNGLGLGYMIANASTDRLMIQNTFDYQNMITTTIIGDDVYQKMDVRKTNSHQYTILNDVEEGYLGVNNVNVIETDISINGNIIRKNYNAYKGIVKLGNLKKGDIITFSHTASDFIPHFYSLDTKTWNEKINVLSDNTIDVMYMNKNKMEFHINNNSDWDTLLLTIPYDKSFTVKIDGKKATFISLFDTFFSLKVPKGSHKVEIEYIPTLLTGSTVITVIGILLSFLYYTKSNLCKEF